MDSPTSSIKGRTIVFFIRLFSRLPLRVAQCIGASLGLLLNILPLKPNRIAAVNIQQCFPQLNARQRWWLKTRSWLHTGRNFAESMHVLFADPDKVVAKVEIEGEEYLEQARAAGRGVILAAPHLGSWEVAGLFCSSRYAMTTLYRPQRNQALDQAIRQGREKLGATLVPTNREGVTALLKTLRANGTIAILPDQDPRHKNTGVFAPFFGISAHTTHLLARLAAKTEAQVLFAYAERLPRGRFRFRISPAAPAIKSPDPVAAVTAMNLDIEALILRDPAQYWWSYARFKRRPENQPELY